jgi:predicted nucleic acid-binding Zn ribbon protein
VDVLGGAAVSGEAGVDNRGYSFYPPEEGRWMYIGGGMYQRVVRHQHCICGSMRFPGEDACGRCGVGFDLLSQLDEETKRKTEHLVWNIANCRDDKRIVQRKSDMRTLAFLRKRLTEIREQADDAARDPAHTAEYQAKFAELRERIDAALMIDVTEHAAEAKYERLVF